MQRSFPSKTSVVKHYSDHIVALGSHWKVKKADSRRLYLFCGSAGCSASVWITFRANGAIVANETNLNHEAHAENRPMPLLAHIHNVASNILAEMPNLSMEQYYSIASEMIGCPVPQKILWRARRRMQSLLNEKQISETESLH